MTLEAYLELLNPEDCVYEPNSARRIMCGHLSNHYAGAIDVATAAVQLRALGELGAAGADLELSGMCEALAKELEEGKRPTLVMPQLGIQVAPAPEQEVSYSGRDPLVLSEDQVAEQNARALEEAQAPREPLEQLTPTQVAEAGAPAPEPRPEEPRA